MSSADPRENSGVLRRSRSTSRACSWAAAMSRAVGRSSSWASSSAWMIQDSKLRLAGGNPRPQPLSRPDQSMALKWSPEL